LNTIYQIKPKRATVLFLQLFAELNTPILILPGLEKNVQSLEKNVQRRGETSGLVRLAGGWWLRLIYCERKILLAG
jgi:hypothetical protein